METLDADRELDTWRAKHELLEGGMEVASSQLKTD